MQKKKAIITYLDEFGIWPKLQKDLFSYFPMRNLVWNNNLQQTTRLISELEIDIVPFNREEPYAAPVALQLPPFLNLYFVSCDDGDVYRQVVKNQIKDWHDIVTNRKPQEWLIVHVTKQALGMASFMNLRMSVYDRIRSDFNVNKKERCVQLRLFDGEIRDGDSWNVFIEAFKECVMSCFDQYVTQYEEDIRRLDAQRQMPGWNFCTFFLLKETLALSYESMNLLDDALLVYDELDASFFQLQKDRTLAWFKQFGGTDKGDDSADLFDRDRKVYRKLIMENKISLFDMHIYQFAQQCHLLMHLKKEMDACERAYKFLTSFRKTIRQNKTSLPKHFEESWVFSVCMNIANKCKQVPSDRRRIPSYFLIQSDMLYTARKQLDKFGIYSGNLPNTPPFSVQLVDAVDKVLADERPSGVTNEQIFNALQSREAFDQLYLGITKDAHATFVELGKDKYIWMLDADAASVHLTRGNYAQAVELLRKLCNRYQRAGWHTIEYQLRVKLAQCQKELGQLKEYAEACLQLLHEPGLLPKGLVETITQDLIKNAPSVEEAPRPFEPIFNVEILHKVESTNEEVGIEVAVKSRLTIDFPFDMITLKMIGGDMTELLFKVRDAAVQPGETKFILFCDNAVAGNYVVEFISMKLGGIMFTTNFLNDVNKPVFRISPYSSPLKAEASFIQDDDINRILIRLNTRHHSIASGSLSLTPLSDVISFTTDTKAEYACGDSLDKSELSKTGGTLSGEVTFALPSCSENEKIDIYLPFSSQQQQTITAKVKLNIDYVTEDGRQFTFMDIKQVDMSNAISVRQSVRMMGDLMLLRVNLTSESDVPIRLVNQQLKLSPEYELVQEGQSAGMNAIVFPQECYSLLYKVRCKRPQSENSKNIVKIGYTLLNDELFKYLSDFIYAHLQHMKLEKHANFVNEHIRDNLLAMFDINAFAITGQLTLTKSQMQSFEAALVHENNKTRLAIMTCLDDLFKKQPIIRLADLTFDRDAAYRKGFQGVLQFPDSELTTLVEFNPIDTRSVVIEQQIAFKLYLYQICSGELESSTLSELFVELLDDRENWLICGKKRMRVVLTPKERLEFKVSLVPLKTGTLPLPRVSVTYLSSTVPNASVRVKRVETAVVLPKTRGASFFLDRV